VASTFGGVIPTPALDRIARDGLRYTNFHSTALCSPTRAALITGRNHHSAGYGVVAEQATGYPGYDSIITKDKATIGRILTDNGYHTAWFGKNHNTPEYQASQAGPFDQWPTGMATPTAGASHRRTLRDGLPNVTNGSRSTPEPKRKNILAIRHHIDRHWRNERVPLVREYFYPLLMSALPPKADMCDATRDVRFGPIADIRTITSVQEVTRSHAAKST
jgi:arylsulfatase A-like enzyme